MAAARRRAASNLNLEPGAHARSDPTPIDWLLASGIVVGAPYGHPLLQPSASAAGEPLEASRASRHLRTGVLRLTADY